MKFRILLVIAGIAAGVLCFAQKKSSRLETEVVAAMYVSKPGENRSNQHDISLLASSSYYITDRFSAGLGTGLLAPYYTTTLIPVYLQSKYTILPKQRIFTQARFGEFIPMSPEEYEGGLFAEVEIGHDIPVTNKSKLRTAIGFSRQEIAIESNNPWRGDGEIKLRYNRIKFSLGWVF